MPVTQTTMKTPRNNKGKPDRVEAGPSLTAIIQPHSGSFISKPIYLNICETYEAVMGWQDRIPRLFCDLCTCNVWLQKISKYRHKGHGNNKHILKATCSNLRGAWWEESRLLPVRGEERRGEEVAGKSICTGGLLDAAAEQYFCSSLFCQKVISTLLMLTKLIRLIPRLMHI